MECPQCHAQNREGRQFCAKCGIPLTLACAECGAVNAADDDFCGGCGKALARTTERRPPQSVEPERRQLTVMFCDLVGSTELSLELDPEDLHEVVRAYQSCASTVIRRYDGFIARYVGDGILVYFGYPLAHEDDAARAIHAGLDIVDALEHSIPAAHGPLSVRIGIATGLVVVGDVVGEGASQQSVATGETPNLAARLQALAEPNTVVVAERTRELAGRAFEYVDSGVHELRGFPQPVRAWSVSGTREAGSRFDAAQDVRLTPFVGRERELELLIDRWHRTRAGDGQVVLLSGEAGIGKSRIGERLDERIAGESHVRLCYQCSPFHTNTALYPFIQHIERAADFRRGDTVECKLDKLETLLARSKPANPEETALFAALLSLPSNGRYPPLQMSSQQQKEKTIAALLERLRVVALKAPLLVVFEDVHWIDPTSLEYLDLAARHIAGMPVLAIVTSRLHVDYPWLAAAHASALHLDRLDRDHSAEMVARVLENRGLPADVVEQIVVKTDGVPLFIEELTKTVGLSGPRSQYEGSPQRGSPVIPSTLQDSLMARLDRLGAAKEIAQIGAVIGREFTRELLAAVSPLSESELEAALGTLTRSSVVLADTEHPGAPFVFRHALLQDAAYASLLRSKRQDLHSRIAETLRSSYPERVRIEPEVIAHHYSESGSALTAAHYWAAAAQRALDRWANAEALGHATKGLAVLETLPPGRNREQLELGLEILRGAAYRVLKGFASSDAEHSFQHALALSTQLGDSARLMDARRGLFSCYYARGALALAREQAREVAALGAKSGDSGARMLGQWMLGCVAFWQGDFEPSRVALEEAFSLYDPAKQKANALALQIDPGVNALLHLSWLRWFLGDARDAISASEQAVATARELAQPFALAMALFWACSTHVCCGEHAALRRLLDELQALTSEQGLGYLGSCARVLEAQYLNAHGDAPAALRELGLAFAEFQSQEAGVGLPWAISISAVAYGQLGKAREGLAALAKAFEAVERNGERQWEAELWRLKGELLRMLQEPDEPQAEACFRRALEIARSQSAKSLELRAATSLAKLLFSKGETQASRSLLRAACESFGDSHVTADTRAARRALEAMG